MGVVLLKQWRHKALISEEKPLHIDGQATSLWIIESTRVANGGKTEFVTSAPGPTSSIEQSLPVAYLTLPGQTQPEKRERFSAVGNRILFPLFLNFKKGEIETKMNIQTVQIQGASSDKYCLCGAILLSPEFSQMGKQFLHFLCRVVTEKWLWNAACEQFSLACTWTKPQGLED